MRRKIVVGTVIAGALILLLMVVGTYRREFYRVYGLRMDMRTVGRAAIEYLRENGFPPEDTADLLASGIFTKDGSGQWLVSVQGGLRADALALMQLHFPPTARGYTLVNGDVVAIADGAEPMLIRCDDVPTEQQRDENRQLAKVWLEVSSQLSANQEKGRSGPEPESKASDVP